MTKNKQNSQFMIMLVITLGLFLAVFLVLQQTNFLPRAGSTTEQFKVKSDQDLKNAAENLDNVDINSLDNDLNLNSQDISNF